MTSFNSNIHPGFHIMEAMNKGYDYHNMVVDQHVQEVNRLNECVQQLTHFQQEINAQRHTGRVELNTDEQRAMVDGVRELLPNAIPPHTYTWGSKEEIDGLLESINQEIRVLMNQMNPESSRMVEAFDNRKMVVTEFNKLMKEFIDHINRIVRQQRV